MDSIARLLFAARFPILLLVLSTSAILWWFSKPVAFDQSIEGFFPSDAPSLLAYQSARDSFGSDDLVFVVYDDAELWSVAGMNRLETLATSFTHKISAVERIESLNRMPVPWRVDEAARTLASGTAMERLRGLPKLMGGLASIETEVRAAENNTDELRELRQRVCAHPLFRQVLVDSAGRSTALVVRLNTDAKNDLKRAVREIREIADLFGRDHRLGPVAVVGPQVLIADGFIHLERDNRTLGVVAMAFMALTMLVAARSVWWAILPLISGVAAWLVTQQLLNWFDLQLTLSAGPIVAQSIILCMPAVSHLAMHFRQSSNVNTDLFAAATETLQVMATPIMWCTLTAAAGYLALLTSSVRPVVQFGTIMAVCSLVAALLTFVLAPAAMRARRHPRRKKRMEVVSFEVSQLTQWAITRPHLAIALFVFPTLALAMGLWRLEFESNYIRIFKPHSRIATDYRFVEERMGGIGIVELVFAAPQRPTHAWINQLATACEELAQSDPHVVSHVLSVSDVVRTAADKNALSEAEAERVLDVKLRALSTPVYRHFLDNFWAVDEGRMRVLVRIRESVPAENKQATFDRLQQKLSARLGGPPVTITGLSYLMTQVTRAITVTQFQTAALSAGVTLLMLCVALRSVRLGVIALLPTCIAVVLVLGVMGWLGIRIDLSTALVTSVAIGLSVDDTFHCLLEWQREQRSGKSVLEALRIGYAGTGPGVVLSSSAVSLGFLALIFSEFVPTANFGWLVAIATLGGSLGNLVVLPACLAISHKRS